MNEIWYIDYPKGGTSKGIRVGLNPDGSADLSALPDDLRRNLEDFGVPDELHRGKVSASEGERFLQLLVAEHNPYRIFRASPPSAGV
jgi:hypothetical protein